LLALRLTIENETTLPDGGPLSVTITGQRGLDIGRDTHHDWVLPDPTRFISGKHAEVRFRDGGYWLTDVSTNGTFVNGSDKRPTEPRRLRDGDRLEIGKYLIAVEVRDGSDSEAMPAPASAPVAGDVWSVGGEVAPEEAAAAFRPKRRATPVQDVDMLNWAMDMPFAAPPAGPAQATPPADDVWGLPPIPAARAPVPPASAAPGPAAEAAAPVPAGFEDIPPLPVGPAVAEPPAPAGGAMPATSLELLRETPPVPARPQPARPAQDPRPPAAAPPPAPAPAVAARGAGDQEILARFARGAGIPPELLAGRDPAALAEELGVLMRLMTGELKQLLEGRAQTKGAMRSANQTMVQALDNNPLRFAPTPEEAVKIMFGPRSASYLAADAAVRKSFGDIKAHQMNIFIAMQGAVRSLAEQLDPKAVDSATPQEKSLGAVFTNRKATLWDAYVARWSGLTAPHDAGLLGAFLAFFVSAYDRRS
jgi:type VI secretion system protein ImpI